MGDERRIDLDAPRSTREVLGAAAGLYRSYPWLFFVLAAGVMIPWELAVYALAGEPPLHGVHQSFATSVTLALLRTTLIGGLISALHIHAVLTIGDGRRPHIGRVALLGLRALPVVVAAEAAATLATIVGFILLILPGVLLSLMLAVTAQAAALEGSGWTGALRSSRELTKENYAEVFVLLLVTGAIAIAADAAARALPLGSATGAASVIVGLAVDTAAASLTALVLALLYFSLRARTASRTRQSAL